LHLSSRAVAAVTARAVAGAGCSAVGSGCIAAGGPVFR
jgi:hypothetical protein